MKKICLLLLFAVGVFGSQAIAQDEVKNGAKIEFEKKVHDYGTVKYGGDRICYFVFTNTGNAPLLINKAIGSCGCTVPSWPKEPIAPGETAKLTVEYNTKKVGAINKSVTITSNAVNEPTKVIRIKGNVLPQATDGAPINTGGPTN